MNQLPLNPDSTAVVVLQKKEIIRFDRYDPQNKKNGEERWITMDQLSHLEINKNASFEG